MKLIRNCRIADGTGKPLFYGDILIDGEKISDILSPGTTAPEGCEVIDGSGLVAAPGFIDAHSHHESRKLRMPACRTQLMQGVTTEICGNCGAFCGNAPGSSGNVSWNDLQTYLDVLDKQHCGTNTVIMAGHNALRRAVMGDANRAPDADEMKEMKRLLSETLEMGGAGVTFGLTYLPGQYSETPELVEFASCLQNTGKVVATHMRSEGDKLLEAVQEMVEVARTDSVPLHISHLKTIFPRNFHKLQALLEAIEKERRNGVMITADRYPYIYSCTKLRQILPPPYDLIADIRGYLQESDAHFAEITAALKASPRDLPTTQMCSGEFRGRTLADIAAEQKCTVEETAARLLRDAADPFAAYLCMSEENLGRILEQPWLCCGSDGLSMTLDDPTDFSHPRSVGTAPKFFRMTSDKLGIAEAVRKQTGLPAAIFNLKNRGEIKKGYIADIVIFDPETMNSMADYGGSNITPAGVKKVLVAGETAFDAALPEKIFPGHGRYLPVSSR